LLFRWIFRDPRVDVRFLALGGLLPLMVDGVWAMAVSSVAAGTKLAAHSLLTAVALMFVIMVFTKRGPARKPWMALSVGVFFHLLLDGMWAQQESFLWPLFGSEFTSPAPDAASLFLGFVDGWVGWVQESLGLVYLVALWRSHGLGNGDTRADFLRTGVLPSVTKAATSS
jgi:hypothetical protein